MIAAGLTHSKELWYLMRASGLVAVVLLTFALVGGIVNVRRFAAPRWPRVVTVLLHRNVALLAAAFLAVHVATAALDSYVVVGKLAVIIPFTSHWDRVWVSLGTAAVDSLLAVMITSLLRGRLSYRTWRNVHWLAYVTWPLAIVHGFSAGTDSGAPWALSVYAAALALVVVAIGWRLRRPLASATGPVGPRHHVPPGPHGNGDHVPSVIPVAAVPVIVGG
jgi:sulfoxide reductase heme-binding subunit YedZ